ncbi:hypothetical protein CMUS01_16602 [Colletotrichum musicola]|uniref:Uncharacterized protein n=1 Tax=Colletotrichum musicola TaxID=2175873 RepID=A0A8H6MHG9_9PEZI|nr:hypothetical protein CMUS01_16602 [Colletotrichum musicola]
MQEGIGCKDSAQFDMITTPANELHSEPCGVYEASLHAGIES